MMAMWFTCIVPFIFRSAARFIAGVAYSTHRWWSSFVGQRWEAHVSICLRGANGEITTTLWFPGTYPTRLSLQAPRTRTELGRCAVTSDVPNTQKLLTEPLKMSPLVGIQIHHWESDMAVCVCFAWARVLNLFSAAYLCFIISCNS